MFPFIDVVCDKCQSYYAYLNDREDPGCTSAQCATPQSKSISSKDVLGRHAQLSSKDTPVVWKHPVTGEVRHPGRNDGEIPKYYKDLGYERHEIKSYREHQQFNKEHGLVNHAAEGIK